MKRAKPFEISKKVVWEAWKRVKANHGAAGVDEESIADFAGRHWVGPRGLFDILDEQRINGAYFGLRRPFLNPKLSV